jgi:asparagine N-glycosylation enzyme membrane subunit Stt3
MDHSSIGIYFFANFMGKKSKRLRKVNSQSSVSGANPSIVVKPEIVAKSAPEPAVQKKDTSSEGIFGVKYPKFVREHKTAVSLVLSFLLVFLVAYGAYSVRTVTSNQQYLLGADDPYYWSRLTTIIVSGDIPQNDTVRLHPDEEPAFNSLGLFPYIGAWFYQAAHAVTGVDLYRSFFYFSPFFAALAVIPAFWIGRELHSNKAGIFAAFFIAFTPSFLFRSMGGYYDTDAIIMLCSTLVIALFLAAYNRIDTKNWKKPAPIILAALAGIVLIIFEVSWSGWAYIPWLFAGFFALHEGYQLLVSEGSGIKEKFKNSLPFLKSHLLIYVVMLLSATVFWVGFHATTTIYEGGNPLSEVLSVTSFFQSAKAEGGIFPNVWIYCKA